MQRVLVKISYNGAQFLGFQIQNQGRTIQGYFEKILKRMHQQHVRIHPSSRTDRGVHAKAQYFHFDTHLNITPERWQHAMNSALPDDIYVHDVSFIDQDFHCRYDCVGKRYRYSIYQRAAPYFVGTHNFTTFCSQKTEVESKERTIYESRIEQTADGIDFVITGSGFLYNMVRVIMAYLLEVGKGKRSADDVPNLLAQQDRNLVPHTAPAEGLYLEKIYLAPEQLTADFGDHIQIHSKKSTQI